MTENAEDPAQRSRDWTEGTALQALAIWGLWSPLPPRSPSFPPFPHGGVASKAGRALLCLPDGNQRQAVPQLGIHSGRNLEHSST